MKQAIAEERIVIVPTGSTEQHGPHLPIDTDIVNAYEISKQAAKKVGALVAPPLYYGISPHWMNYPGTMSVRQDTFVDFLSQICSSLAKHGFKRLVIVNGHGGNDAAVQLAAQNIAESGGGRCIVAALSYWNIASQEINSIRESPRGGIAHACELETSLQLHFRGDLVRMQRAKKNMMNAVSDFSISDLTDGKRGAFIYKVGGGGTTAEPGESGVIGDPTIATKEKGERFFGAISERLASFLGQFSEIEVNPPTT